VLGVKPIEFLVEHHVAVVDVVNVAVANKRAAPMILAPLLLSAQWCEYCTHDKLVCLWNQLHYLNDVQVKN